jgi:hypothetical protein
VERPPARVSHPRRAEPPLAEAWGVRDTCERIGGRATTATGFHSLCIRHAHSASRSRRIRRAPRTCRPDDTLSGRQADQWLHLHLEKRGSTLRHPLPPSLLNISSHLTQYLLFTAIRSVLHSHLFTHLTSYITLTRVYSLAIQVVVVRNTQYSRRSTSTSTLHLHYGMEFNRNTKQKNIKAIFWNSHFLCDMIVKRITSMQPERVYILPRRYHPNPSQARPAHFYHYHYFDTRYFDTL